MEQIVRKMLTNVMEESSYLTADVIMSHLKAIEKNQLCALLYYIMTEFLHLIKITPQQRQTLGNIVIYLIGNNYLSIDHLKLAYVQFLKNDVSYLQQDVPLFWQYIFDFIGKLIIIIILFGLLCIYILLKYSICLHYFLGNMVICGMLTITDLVNESFKDLDNYEIKTIFLNNLLKYCTSNVGPKYTRKMWKKYNMKWSDYMSEEKVAEFIRKNVNI